MNDKSSAYDNSLAIERTQLRKILKSFNLSEKDIINITTYLDKARRHINIINFIILLERYNIKRDSIRSILRRIGFSDKQIDKGFEAHDEKLIMDKYGRLFEIDLVD
ncbi:MAG: hypothetical protein ARM1_0452 [Candidatus Micrarchaeota archaeon]|nr:MAG: hypothetical protein ARM1_0452 [Candidatus Micrarchaeota archaeon]